MEVIEKYKGKNIFVDRFRFINTYAHKIKTLKSKICKAFCPYCKTKTFVEIKENITECLTCHKTFNPHPDSYRE